MKARCLLFFDPHGDSESETADFLAAWDEWAKACAAVRDVTWRKVENLQEFFANIPDYDFIFFDYGGLSLPGHESVGMSFARKLEGIVADNPQKEFVCIANLAPGWYSQDFGSVHPNLHFKRGCDLFQMFKECFLNIRREQSDE